MNFFKNSMFLEHLHFMEQLMGLKQKNHETIAKFAPSFFLFQVNQPCKKF